MEQTGRKMDLWQGACYVHVEFTRDSIHAIKTEHPDAKVVAHPECTYAVRMLAGRMRSERDLRRLMKARAFEGAEGEKAMDAVVVRLKELNYLSDTRFAADYTRLRKENEKFGRRRVQQDLAAKGVASETVGAAVGAAYEGVDEVALARAYVARKRMKQPAGEKAKKESARVMGRLLRAGFSVGTVFKVLKDWGVEVEEVDLDGESGLDDLDAAE